MITTTLILFLLTVLVATDDIDPKNQDDVSSDFLTIDSATIRPFYGLCPR